MVKRQRLKMTKPFTFHSLPSSITHQKVAQHIALCLEQLNPLEESYKTFLQEATFFLQDLLQLSALEWLDQKHLPFPEKAKPLLEEAMTARLNQRKPFSRWRGQQTFLNHTFFLNPWTLDPRPESEGLVLKVLQLLCKERLCHPLRILELGTGTGCLLLSLLSELPKATGIGIDLESRVFEVAQRNAEALNLKDRVSWLQSDWLKEVRGRFDCILSNPPYIDPTEKLPPEVSLWDPALALFAGEEGLEAYRTFIPEARQHLNPEGFLALEIGHTQAQKVSDLLRPWFQSIEIEKDLSGKNRYIIAK
jgi:release factor glutamine methyltransferase